MVFDADVNFINVSICSFRGVCVLKHRRHDEVTGEMAVSIPLSVIHVPASSK